MNYQKVRNVKSPQYGTDGAAGLDFFVPDDLEWDSKLLQPGQTVRIPSGIKVELSHGTCLIGLNKSSIGLKGLMCSCPLVDEDYRGEISLVVTNCSHDVQIIRAGQKLLQFVITPYFKETLNESIIETSGTARGNKGFGSTGA